MAELHRHPDMTSAELAAIMGTTPSAVRCARSRFGRWPGPGERLCAACGERIVFAESRQARRWHLCKACYLRERSLRDAEEAESARVRQAARRAKRG